MRHLPTAYRGTTGTRLHCEDQGIDCPQFSFPYPGFYQKPNQFTLGVGWILMTMTVNECEVLKIMSVPKGEEGREGRHDVFRRPRI